MTLAETIADARDKSEHDYYTEEQRQVSEEYGKLASWLEDYVKIMEYMKSEPYLRGIRDGIDRLVEEAAKESINIKGLAEKLKKETYVK